MMIVGEYAQQMKFRVYAFQQNTDRCLLEVD